MGVNEEGKGKNPFLSKMPMKAFLASRLSLLIDFVKPSAPKSLYENQIFALLGHNGAGKVTPPFQSFDALRSP
jgi:hypothetical protein